MTAGPIPVDAMHAPRLRRRLGAFIYEGVLLFGVIMAAGLVYALLTNQRHALQGSTGLRIYLFVVLGLYFVWFWTRQGQTLAMRTWRIKLVTVSGDRPGALRASCRYLVAWLWFLPALLSLWLWGVRGGGAAFGAVTVGVLAYAALAWLNPQRQFLHDIVCGTRLVTWVPLEKS